MELSMLKVILCIIECLFVIVEGLTSVSVKDVTVCEDQSTTLKCPGNSKIVIKEAMYGHLQMGECIHIDTSHFGCKISVLDVLNNKCFGKHTCEISELDQEIRSKNPCAMGLDVFMEIQYICIGAESLQPCKPTVAKESQYFISSQQSLNQHCGSHRHRGGTEFSIKAKQGQKMKLSSLTLSSIPGQNATRQVGYVLDEVNSNVSPLLINVKRGDVAPVMVTESNDITISISPSQGNYFLLFIIATGCEDLVKPNGMWIQRNGYQTTVGCENFGTERSWNLHCKGVHWSGVIGNCSESAQPVMGAVVRQSVQALALPKDIIFVTIVGITIVLALIIVTMGYVCYKRTLEPLEPMEPNTTKPNIAYNNLLQPTQPPLPEKRGSTLMRNQPNQAAFSRPQLNSVPDDSLMWEPPAPLPPPRREPRDTGATSLEAVPLRSGDMILDNGNETILVRGHFS